MKRSIVSQVVLTFVLALSPLASRADTFFSDTFTNGSTINSGSPANPTATNTAYQVLSSKTQTPTPAVGSGTLTFGIASSSSGLIEIQALFATNPIALVQPGDNIQLTIVFTNRSGILPASPGTSQLDVGLFYSGNISPFNPLPGGTNVSTGLTISDYTQKWQGYVGQIVSGASKILTRPSQVSATDGWNQELVLSGSSTATARGQSTVGSSTTTAVSLTTGGTYTEVLSITKNDVNSLAITNTLYSGPDTSGAVMVSSGGIATNTTFLTGGFNGFGFGYQSKVAGASNTIDVSSVVVSGSVTVISGPPTITQEPAAVTVATSQACAFFVTANGYNVTYQWHRFGTNLVDGGSIQGSTSDTLIVSPAGAADVASGANGYYVTVSGAGGFSTNSITNSLSLRPATNLTWNAASGGVWDLNNTASWQDNVHGVNPTTFNFGDPVTFDDTAALKFLSISGKFLSASSITVTSSANYTFNDGGGSIAGPGTLNLLGGLLTVKNVNSYTGGTIISNTSGYLILQNMGGLGTGPVTLARAGSWIDVTPNGSASAGLGGVNATDDGTVQFDGFGSFAGVVLGDIAASAGKTLSFSNNITTTNRLRIYGTNTVFNGNLFVDGAAATPAIYSGTVLAPYNPSGVQTYNGIISGNAGLAQRGNGTTILNGQNTYSGGTFPTAGAIGFGANSVGSVSSGPIGTGPLYLVPELPNTTANGQVFASGGARTIANPLQYPSGTNNLTLIVGGTNDLTFSGPVTLNGNDSLGTATARTFQVTNTGLTTISGVISDGGAGWGLTKTGSGRLALSNTETYGGATLVSGGTLLVNGQIGSGAVTVTNATLGGTGTIGGPVTIQTNATLAPGNGAIGTLTINNTLTLAGGSTTAVEINKTSSTADRVNVTTVSYNGTLLVTNLSGTLTTNDQFTLFSATTPSGNFTNVTGVAGAGLGFTFNPATGVLKVVQTIATNPTNITFAVSGNNLSLTWPGDHLGWELQSNAVSLTSTSAWFVVPNSTSVTNVTMPVDASKTNVFYRLHLP